jgi:hypothetical protein
MDARFPFIFNSRVWDILSILNFWCWWLDTNLRLNYISTEKAQCSAIRTTVCAYIVTAVQHVATNDLH